MSRRRGAHSGDWYLSYCDCGCGTVRLHVEGAGDIPSTTLVFTAERAVETAEELIKGARNAGLDVAAHAAPPCPTAH